MEKEKNLNIIYIVYCTICKKNKKIYIGVHKTTNKFDGYLGCGVFENKPSSYKKGKTLFQRAVNKYGPKQFIRVTLFEFFNLNDALKKESEIVTESFLERKDVYNETIGGGYPPHKTRQIYQYDLNGNFIKEYSSIKEASIDNKIKYLNVAESIKLGQSCHGFLWSYNKIDKMAPFEKYNSPRKVAVYKNDKLLKIYNTVRDCKKDYCGCVHVLSGQRKTCKKCTFKYIN